MINYSQAKEQLEIHKVKLAISPWVSNDMLQQYQQFDQLVTDLSPETNRIATLAIPPVTKTSVKSTSSRKSIVPAVKKATPKRKSKKK